MKIWYLRRLSSLLGHNLFWWVNIPSLNYIGSTSLTCSGYCDFHYAHFLYSISPYRYLCGCTHVCLYVRICVCVHPSILLCRYACMCICMHVWVQVCLCGCAFCTVVCVCLHMRSYQLTISVKSSLCARKIFSQSSANLIRCLSEFYQTEQRAF